MQIWKLSQLSIFNYNIKLKTELMKDAMVIESNILQLTNGLTSKGKLEVFYFTLTNGGLYGRGAGVGVS